MSECRASRSRLQRSSSVSLHAAGEQRRFWCSGFRVAVLSIGLMTFSGCAAYRFGNATLFRPDIRTVYVPVIRNETFRHDLGVRLTEAVIRQIESVTPYKVTGDPNADSTLTCRFNSETKRVLTESSSDDPRALDVAVSVQAAWVSRNGELLMQNAIIPEGDLAIAFSQDARFVPEAGQSVDTATQQAIEQLASRIVSQMELRW